VGLRRARISEVNLLNRIAFQSEGVWNEGDDYMDKFSQSYQLTETMIIEEEVHILEINDRIIGFFAILKAGNHHEMELFYIERSFIGQGYGKKLWNLMIQLCKEKGIRRIEFVGSSDVAQFYKKLGAVELDKIKSILKVGRIVTRFEYSISEVRI